MTTNNPVWIKDVSRYSLTNNHLVLIPLSGAVLAIIKVSDISSAYRDSRVDGRLHLSLQNGQVYQIDFDLGFVLDELMNKYVFGEK